MESQPSQKGKLEREIARLIGNLPPMPGNVDLLLQAAARRESDAPKLCKMVGNDPGLCANLLHLANTCYVQGRPVTSVEEAVTLVGIEPLANLVGATYANDIVGKTFSHLEHLGDYFDHSQAISRTCPVLAEVLSMSAHERRLYAAMGLVHDIGRLVIAVVSQEFSVPLVGTSWDKMATITHDEARLLGMNHCDVGMEICKKWQFASIFADGLLRHHTPILDDDFSMPGAVVFVSHFISGSDFTGETIAQLLPHRLLDRMGLTADMFNAAKELYRAGGVT